MGDVIEKSIKNSIEKVIVFNLAGLLLLGPFFQIWVKIFLYVSAVLALGWRLSRYRWRAAGNFIPRTSLDRPLSCFILALIGSILFSLDRFQSQEIFFTRIAGYVLAFLLGAVIVGRNKKNVVPLVAALTVGGLLVGVGGIWDVVRLSPVRLFTSFGRDVNMSVLLSLYVPFFFALAFCSKGLIYRWAGGVGLICLFPALVLNYSRAVWIAVGLALAVMTVLKNKRFLPLLLAAFAVWLLVSPEPFQYRMSRIFHQEPRVAMSRTALEIFEDFPVLGAGLGMFEKLRPVYDPQPAQPYIHADNTFSELLAETGLAGLVSFLWIFTAFFGRMFHELKRTDDKDTAAVHMGLAGAVFSCLVVSFGTNAVMVGFQNAVFFWLLLGLAAGLAGPAGVKNGIPQGSHHEQI